MKNQLNQFLNQFKTIGLLGYGVEGKSSYRYLRKYFQELTIIIFDDKNEVVVDTEQTIYYPLKDWSEYISKVDLWIKSPGIPWSQDMEKNKANFTSQSELFIKYCVGKKIGITGSLGKSTTSQFLYDALESSNKQSFLGGNIGQPLFNFIDYVCEEDVVIMELSSYQLKNITCSPDIAVLLNMYPDHLDYHLTKDDYFTSKSRIGRFQIKGCSLIYHCDISKKYIKGAGDKINFSATNKSADFFAKKSTVLVKNKFEISIDQNKYWKDSDRLNLCAVIAVLTELGMKQPEIESSLKSLSALEYRLEPLGEFNGITFYNDSISTIPESAINAIRSVRGIDSIILGGFNRGIDQQKLIDELIKNEGLKLIFCLGETGKIIYDALNINGREGLVLVDDYDYLLNKLSGRKDIKKCVFSPGAPSFGLYKNFIERGKAFQEALSNWKI